MAIRTTVLSETSADSFAASVPSGSTPASAASVRAYAELAARLSVGGSGTIAFGSVNRREGVTRTIRGLAAELFRAGGTVAAVDAALRPISIAAIPDLSAHIPGASATTPQKRDLSELRDYHDWVLVDCGSLNASMDLLRVAPLADGVVLVIECGGTAREQIDRVAQLIHEARGKLLGFVFNKRRYPVPGWLYRGL